MVWVDFLKGLAIILVVIGHNANDDIKEFIYCFHMPLFFIMSGFLFSPKPIKQYFRKSVKRLVIPYIAFMIVIAMPQIISIVMNGGKMTIEAWNLLASGMLFGGQWLQGVFGVFWFISVLWIATNLFNCILFYKVKAWMLLILILGGYFAAMIPYSIPWNIHIVPMALAYIWIGFLIKLNLKPRVTQRLNRCKSETLLCALIVLAIVFVLRHELTMDMKYGDYGMYGASIVSSVLSSIAVAVIAVALSANTILSKMLCTIGTASMIIMYVHLPVKYYLLGHFNMQDNYIVSFLAGMVLSYAVYVLLKRFKFTNRTFIGLI